MCFLRLASPDPQIELQIAIIFYEGISRSETSLLQEPQACFLIHALCDHFWTSRYLIVSWCPGYPASVIVLPPWFQLVACLFGVVVFRKPLNSLWGQQCPGKCVLCFLMYTEWLFHSRKTHQVILSSTWLEGEVYINTMDEHNEDCSPGHTSLGRRGPDTNFHPRVPPESCQALRVCLTSTQNFLIFPSFFFLPSLYYHTISHCQ